MFIKLFWIVLLLWGSWVQGAVDPYAEARRQLLETIRQDFKETGGFTGKSELSPQVLKAMETIPRHEFVPKEYRASAYENRPLPIGYGQTISQPYIVALMTELLEPKPDHIVLEVGTGSGYQAAVLAKLVKHVYTIEIIEPLAKQAKERLKRLGFDNVTVKVGDGYHGWKAHAPFDGIIVTAAASHIPPPLVKQLKPSGRMVIPVGGRFLTQYLMLVEKDANGKVHTRQLLPVSFVPLTGGTRGR